MLPPSCRRSEKSSYFVLWLLFLMFLLELNEVDGQCLEQQKSSLLSFKQTMKNFSKTGRLLTWDSRSNCCSWSGVTCNNNGYVTGLDLSNENINFQVNFSSPLSDLQLLTSLNLAGGTFDLETSTTYGFWRLVNLLNLDLSLSNFSTQFPVEISNLTSLVSLDLSYIHFSGDGLASLGLLVENLTSLLELRLDRVNFTAQGNGWSKDVALWLPHLQVLSLSDCGLSGPIHSSFQNLSSLTNIILSGNSFLVPFPDTFSRLKNLTILRLSKCGLSGKIPESLCELRMLSILDVSDNNLEGSFPKSFSKLTSLVAFSILLNNMSGSLPSFSMLKNLTHIRLGGNRFNGSILATKWSELPKMKVLDIPFNDFSDMLRMDMFQSWRNLTYLDLSYNNFSIDVTNISLPFPHLFYLSLANCKVKAFPTLIFDSEAGSFEYLDLSSNQISGLIPHWIWSLRYLNLSHNHLQGFETPLRDFRAIYVDLSSNELQGNIPNMSFAGYVDLSRNLFNSSLFSSLDKAISSAYFFSVANNNLRGRISESICKVGLYALDMSNNFLDGEIPHCLIQQTKILQILNLMNNSISSIIPDSFPLNCSLNYLNFNRNSLSGNIPKSLGRCKDLAVLDLGRNKLHDVFPCWLGSCAPALKILVLKSNLLYANILCSDIKANWSSLQVIDIASNDFSGILPSQQLLEWNAMMVNAEPKSQIQHLETSISYPFYTYSFNVEVSVAVKGTIVTLQKIPTTFIFIDFSANAFEGIIPEEFGHLKGLRSLNISHNRLTGQIPASLGNLEILESLDLRNNELNGTIPADLASLTSLSVLNVSFNQLEGEIPTGRQFQTFTEYEFLHNKELCGFPLTKRCGEEDEIIQSGKSTSKVGDSVWISAEVGFTLGLGFIAMPLVFWPGWRRRFNEFIDKIISNIICFVSRKMCIHVT